MKNIVERLSGFIDRHFEVLGIGLMALCFLFWLAVSPPYDVKYDTESYFQAWGVLKTGRIDLVRTPLYPILVGPLFEFLPFSWALLAVRALQTALLFLSVWCFCRILRHLPLNPLLRLGAVAAFCVIGFNSNFARILLTDSPGTSMVIVYFYLLYRYFSRGGGLWSTFGLCIMLLGCIMLRPANLYLLILTALVGLLWWAEKSAPLRKCLRLGAVVCGVGLAVGLYAAAFESRAGYWSLTVVGDINEIENITTYERLTHRLEVNWPAYTTARELHDVFAGVKPGEFFFSREESLARALHHDLQQILTDNPGIGARAGLKVYQYNLGLSGIVGATRGWDYLITAVFSTVYVVYLSLGRMSRRKQTYWLIVALWLAFMGCYSTVALSAPWEYGRLMASANFAIFTLWALMIQRLWDILCRRRSHKATPRVSR